MLKAIIFDFDGVLGDTFDKNLEICRRLGMEVTEEDFRDHHNGNVYEKPKLRFTPESVGKFFRMYEEQADAKLLFPLKNQLDVLAGQYRLFIISSNEEKGIYKYLDAGGWRDFFKGVYGLETDKSKVKKLKMIFDNEGIGPDECLFITDTLGDILECKKAGVRVISVTWGYHGKDRLAEGCPDMIIDSFSELVPSIKKVGAEAMVIARP